MKKIIILGISVLVLNLAWAQKPNVVIQGKISDKNPLFTEAQLRIAYKNAPAATVAPINEKGEFKFEFYAEQADIYRIFLSNKESVLITVYPNDKLKLTIDGAKPDRYLAAEGSKSLTFFMQTIHFLDSLAVDFDRSTNKLTDNAALAALQQSYHTNLYNGLKQKISNNKNDLAVLVFAEIFPKTAEFQDFVKDIYANLLKIYPKNELVVGLNAPDPNAIGGEAPEINLPNPEGKNIKLSSLRGKVVLIDFWASWCGPCRKENPNVVKLYQKYHDKGFEVYGVSLDRNKEQWINAIAADKLTWTQVSDLKGWESAAGKTYGVSSIPHTVLVDRKGNIIARNLRGYELDAKLREIFGF